MPTIMGHILTIYQAVRLNGSSRGWGVVYRLTGALVLSDGMLLVRLSEAEAHDFVARQSSQTVPAATGFPRRPLGRKRKAPLGGAARPTPD